MRPNRSVADVPVLGASVMATPIIWLNHAARKALPGPTQPNPSMTVDRRTMARRESHGALRWKTSKHVEDETLTYNFVGRRQRRSSPPTRTSSASTSSALGPAPNSRHTLTVRYGVTSCSGPASCTRPFCKQPWPWVRSTDDSNWASPGKPSNTARLLCGCTGKR